MDPKSVTIPDQSLTIHELLENHTRGVYSKVKIHQPNYLGIEIPKFDDITEALEYRAELNMRKIKLEQELSDMQAEKQEKEREAVRSEIRAQKLLKEAREASEAFEEEPSSDEGA